MAPNKFDRSLVPPEAPGLAALMADHGFRRQLVRDGLTFNHLAVLVRYADAAKLSRLPQVSTER